MANILIIDDEKDMLSLLTRLINEDADHHITCRTDPMAAMADFGAAKFDLVITDLKMPKLNGIRVLESVKETRPDVPVVLMTAYGSIDTAVEAIRKGAFDYITKPFRRERILVTIDKALQWYALLDENRRLRSAMEEPEPFAELFTDSPVMYDLIERIRQVGPTTGTVLITGASGTGKELVARAIHRSSLRRDRKMVTVNCAAIPPEIMESEMFGHVKGAFTGAWQDKKGLVEAAHQSTLFLDEIGELDPRLQARLLRLLQYGEYKPVGSSATRTADLRFIAATNQDLTRAIQAGRFREDLYYRLNVIRFDLPALSERSRDIPLLSYHFLKKYSHINSKPIQSISPEAVETLKLRDYSGNVRELENIIERAVIFCRGDELTRRDLCLEENDGLRDYLSSDVDLFSLPFSEARESVIRQFSRSYIEAALARSGGNVTRAAENVGIQRQYLHRLIKELGVKDE